MQYLNRFSITVVVLTVIAWIVLVGASGVFANFAARQFVVERLSEPDDGAHSFTTAKQHLALSQHLNYARRVHTERLHGFMFWYTGDLQQALEQWRSVPNMDTELIAWGNQERHKGNVVPSLKWYDAALDVGGKHESGALLNKALAFLAAGNEDGAFELFRAAIDSDSGWINNYDRFLGWYHWGRMLHLRDHNQEAQHALETALSVAPRNVPNTPDLSLNQVSEAHRYLGLSLHTQGSTPLAVTEMSKAIAINPNNTWAYVHYGKTLFFQSPDRADETQESFRKAVTLRPDDVALWENLIGFWLWTNDKVRAGELCNLAQENGVDLERVCSFD